MPQIHGALRITTDDAMAPCLHARNEARPFKTIGVETSAHDGDLGQGPRYVSGATCRTWLKGNTGTWSRQAPGFTNEPLSSSLPETNVPRGFSGSVESEPSSSRNLSRDVLRAWTKDVSGPVLNRFAEPSCTTWSKYVSGSDGAPLYSNSCTKFSRSVSGSRSRGVRGTTDDFAYLQTCTKWGRDISGSTVDSLCSSSSTNWSRETSGSWSRSLSGSTTEPLSSPAWSRSNTFDDGHSSLSSDGFDPEDVPGRLSPLADITPKNTERDVSTTSAMTRRRCFRKAEGRSRARNRMVARAGLGISEHIAERLAERTLETVVERTAEHVMEGVVVREGGRSVLDSMLLGLGHHAEKLQAGAASAVQRFMENSGERGLHASIAAQAERRHVLTITSMRLAVVVIGMFLVLHMVHSDLHRAHAELKSWKPSRVSYRLFMLAAILDGIDLVVHVLVFADLAVFSVEHCILHRAESLGLGCAVVGTVALILGELISIPKARRTTQIVACGSDSSP